MAFTKEVFDFSKLEPKSIEKQLADLNIPLTVQEVLKIQKEMLGRAPSLAELVLFSIQGSEHCSYKSSRKHLKQFTTVGPDVVLGAKEDAGVVAIAEDNDGLRWCVVMSHESHNHPSQIVPYEGAATGVGGNVRDVMCMGAEVIACTDSFRFGDIKSNRTKWIHDGAVAGIAGYGNPLGIPNVGGDLYYDSGYNENCLVTLVTLGIVREDCIVHSYAPKKAKNYDLILVGKPTDNSGFGGASFASLELDEEKKEKNKGAVQEPNAFLERHLLKSTYSLFDILKKNNLIDKVGFKDLGAGGVACASVELAEASGYGAEVWMEKIPVGIKGLHPSIYLCSETQERFMWVCPPKISPMIINHYNNIYDLPKVSSGARASVIGKIRENGMYKVHNGEEKIVDAPASEVTKGFLYDRPYSKPKKQNYEPKIEESFNYNKILIAILSHENVCSREPIYEKYDKQVQGRVYAETGLADAGVLAPFNSSQYPEEIRSIGIALSTDHNPRFGIIDPYWCGINAVVEAMRNVSSVGATPHAISDCLCYGNPEKPEQMWAFVEGVRGINDACKTITLKHSPENPTPIIAGNVSFYNESNNNSIPPSPIVSCLGRIKDVKKTVTMTFKKEDSSIIMIGERKNELGGSIFYSLYNELGKNLPKPNLLEVKNQIYSLTDCIDKNLILSCHDISEGGVAATLAEMTFENSIGLNVHLSSDLSDYEMLFSETGGFILEAKSNRVDLIKSIFKKNDIKAYVIGKTGGDRIQINDVIDVLVNKAKKYWENGLREKL